MKTDIRYFTTRGQFDVVIAGEDGVIVVPRERAVEVANAAHEELRLDKAASKCLYKELGISSDFTVKDK